MKARFIIDFGIFLNLFFTGHVLFRGQLPFEFYFSYVPIVIFLPFFILNYKFNTKLLYLLVPLLVTGILNVFISNNEFGNFFKIFLNLVLNFVFYEYVMQYYNYNIKHIFKIYLKISFYIAILGLIQLVSYWLGIKYGYDYSSFLPLNKWRYNPGGLGIRINSTFSEPSYLALSLSPAFFISLYTLLKGDTYFYTRNRAIVVLVCYLLSFSSLGFIGIGITIFLFTLNYGVVRYFLFAIPVGVFFFYAAYTNAEEFRRRIDGLNALFFEDILKLEGKDQEKTKVVNLVYVRKILPQIHGSSFVLYNNFTVAKKNFLNNPLFGTGLGSHELAFDKYNVNYALAGIYRFNVGDANSMLLRLLSETGLMGVLFAIFFVIKFSVTKDINDKEIDRFWLISNSLLTLILLQYLRQGNYTYNGFIMYAWMFYYNKLEYNEYQERQEEKLMEDGEILV
jgi:hypothetical protein